MKTELSNAMAVAGDNAQYDIRAKRLLAQKSILARILLKTVGAFKGMSPEDVADSIEGEPVIGMVPIEPGSTNAERTDGSVQRIRGFNTENSEINEGMIRFDIVFYVRLPFGNVHIKDNVRLTENETNHKLTQIIVNVEAQKDEPAAYKILNRSIFYVSRLVSSQKERDFVNSNYDDIKQVYSIWICMNMDKNSMSHIHLVKDNIIDTYQWKGNLNLLNIIMLGLAKELPEHDETYELHRLLGTLLSQNLTIDEKLTIIDNEYDIPVEEDFRRDVNIMCNLSQGIKEDGIAEGEARIILNMHKNGLTAEQIATYTDTNIDDVIAIIESQKTVLA